METIFYQILARGLLRARAAGWDGNSEQAAVETDHLHNIPSLLEHQKPELLRFYWDVERPSFIADCNRAGIGTEDFVDLWAQLRTIVENQNQPALTK